MERLCGIDELAPGTERVFELRAGLPAAEPRRCRFKPLEVRAVTSALQRIRFLRETGHYSPKDGQSLDGDFFPGSRVIHHHSGKYRGKWCDRCFCERPDLNAFEDIEVLDGGRLPSRHRG